MSNSFLDGSVPSLLSSPAPELPSVSVKAEENSPSSALFVRAPPMDERWTKPGEVSANTFPVRTRVRFSKQRDSAGSVTSAGSWWS